MFQLSDYFLTLHDLKKLFLWLFQFARSLTWRDMFHIELAVDVAIIFFFILDWSPIVSLSLVSAATALIIAGRSSWRDLLFVTLLVDVATGLNYFLHFAPVSIFFWLFFLAILLWNLDARLSIALALASLVIIMILNILSNTGIANNITGLDEQVAIWVYFSLVIGVVKQIYDMAREKRAGTSWAHGRRLTRRGRPPTRAAGIASGDAPPSFLCEGEGKLKPICP